MSNFIHLIVHVTDQFQKDVIIAHLFNSGFAGIEEKEEELHAFTNEDDFNEVEMAEVLAEYHLPYAVSVVGPQNWNAVWESNFEPVTIDDFCRIRADFHPPAEEFDLDIIITPKMSFGTGHHATTYLMVQQMRGLNFTNKKVADFGTGTGVLAIVAEKLGSKNVLAIDSDDFSIENAAENFERNNCFNIELHQANLFSLNEKFIIILANINKNVIIDNLENLVFTLEAGGKILLSGLLKDDEYDVLMACQGYNLRRIQTVERNNWIAILLEHNV